MKDRRNLHSMEAQLTHARGLLNIAHFVIDTCDSDDWAQMKGDFGFLLNSMTDSLGACDRNVLLIYKAANDEEQAA